MSTVIAEQLTIDGRVVPHPAAPGPAPLSSAQKAILRQLGEQGYIRSVEAGLIVHECRSQYLHAVDIGPDVADAYLRVCRQYASSDGNDALKRLANRGLVRRVAPGRWEQA
jgi:hypothetical protein